MANDEKSDGLTPSDKTAAAKKSLSEHITLWVGVISAIVTISLTIWNAHTKSQIDQREADLKELEAALRARTINIEESKERVDRYKWVLSLFPDLNEADKKKNNFTISLLRLALTRDEAEQLFSSLQTSSDKELQSVGQRGITAIQNEPIALLVLQMNASTAEARKSAVATLERDYKSSSQAVTLVLRTYEQDKIESLSPSGIINGLYFLSATEPNAWDQKQVEAGSQIIKSGSERRRAPNKGVT
jgi:hypothetical protein